MIGPYAPPPGTVPFKAIAHLKSLPAGSKVTSHVLAEAVGQPSEALGGFLATARRKGVLGTCPRRDGRPGLLWFLGDGRPEPEETDDEGDGKNAEPEIHVFPTLRAPAPRALDIGPWPRSSAPATEPDSPAVDAPPTAQAKAAQACIPAEGAVHAEGRTAPPEFACGLLSTRRLLLQWPDLQRLMTAEETRELFRYLDQFAAEPLAHAERLSVFEDSAELAGHLRRIAAELDERDAYYLRESAVHIVGLFELSKSLARDGRRSA